MRKGVAVTFATAVEVSLACQRCCRADRTIVLSESSPAAHFGRALGYDGHAFDGCILAFGSDTAPSEHDTDLVTVRYELTYDFQPFTDAKYPERRVSPQPTWGRVHMQVVCLCGRSIDTYTQTNLVRPRRVQCPCGQLLMREDEQVILFSDARPGSGGGA